MLRRHALGIMLTTLFPAIMLGQQRRAKLRSWRIKYRSKPKASITTTTVQAHNSEEAKTKLKKQHPQAVILSVELIK